MWLLNKDSQIMKNFQALITSILLLISIDAFATCDFGPTATYPTNKIQYYTAPLLGNMTISVPAGAAVGDVIYRQTIQIRNFPATRIKCSIAGDFYFSHEYASTPKQRSSYNSTVYETGVPGIGVKMMVNKSITPTNDYPYMSDPVTQCLNSEACAPDPKWYWPNELMFIKTSSNVGAGTISASNLPTLRYLWGQPNNMITLHEVKLSGSIKVTVPTCNISTASGTMTVPMGAYKLQNFTGKGTGTEWKNASINLTGCGRFYGESSASMADFNGSSTTQTRSLANNFWSMTISPYNGIFDTAKGIMNIDDDTLRATGIGIQLSTTQSTTGLVNLSAPVKGALPDDGTQNITIPLYARYIQTGNAVIAGKANGKLMYTITYQ